MSKKNVKFYRICNIDGSVADAIMPIYSNEEFECAERVLEKINYLNGNCWVLKKTTISRQEVIDYLRGYVTGDSDAFEDTAEAMLNLAANMLEDIENEPMLNAIIDISKKAGK